jgi:transcriptional regulator with XRE-family HTH domain
MSPIIVTPRELGDSIRARRKEVGLSAADTAALSRVSRRLLIELERGRRPNVGLSGLLRILQVLGLDLEVKSRGLPGSGVGRRPDV